MIMTAQKPPRNTKAPIFDPDPTSVDAKTFTIIFKRPKTAIAIDETERIKQLRLIFHKATGLSERFIDATVEEQPDTTVFKVTLKSDPHRPILQKNIEEAIARLSPTRVKQHFTDGTGLNPELIEVVEEK